MAFKVRNIRKLENGKVEFEFNREKYIGSWSCDGGRCGECIFSKDPCGSVLDRLFGDDRESCENYKFEKVEAIKMKEETAMQVKDLVVVVDDNGCSNIKNGDIHQVDGVYNDKITLVGKGGVQYFARRFKKVDKKDIPSPEAEIEDVLKIDIVKIDDKYSYAKIAYQNYDILKRGEFTDREINVESYHCFQFSSKKVTLYINGNSEELDGLPVIIKNDLIAELNRRVDAINEKYGIRKKWRAERDYTYYVVDSVGDIKELIEDRTMADRRFWECGNYFKTKEDAENSPLYKAFQEMKSN